MPQWCPAGVFTACLVVFSSQHNVTVVSPGNNTILRTHASCSPMPLLKLTRSNVTLQNVCDATAPRTKVLNRFLFFFLLSCHTTVGFPFLHTHPPPHSPNIAADHLQRMYWHGRRDLPIQRAFCGLHLCRQQRDWSRGREKWGRIWKNQNGRGDGRVRRRKWGVVTGTAPPPHSFHGAIYARMRRLCGHLGE